MKVVQLKKQILLGRVSAGGQLQWDRPEPGGLGFSLERPEPSRNLPLRLDLVAEDEVGGQSEDEKENPQGDKVHVEFGVLDVQQLENLFGPLELAHGHRALQLGAIQPVYGQDHPFKAIPVDTREGHI